MISGSLWGIRRFGAKRFMGFSMGRSCSKLPSNLFLIVDFPPYVASERTLHLGGPLSQKNRFLHIGKIQLKSMHPVGIQDITHYKYLVSAEPRRFTYSILIWLWPRLFTKPLYCSIHLHPITSFSKNKYAFGAQLGCCRAFE